MTPPRSIRGEHSAQVGPRTITPCHDNVVVALDRAAEETTAGGIVLPPNASPQDAAGSRSAKRGLIVGTVLASGPGYYTRKGWFVPTDLRPGDRVWMGSDAGERDRWLAEGEREVRIIRAEEAVAVERAGP